MSPLPQVSFLGILLILYTSLISTNLSFEPSLNVFELEQKEFFLWYFEEIKAFDSVVLGLWEELDLKSRNIFEWPQSGHFLQANYVF